MKIDEPLNYALSRRTFLRGAALAAAGTACPSLLIAAGQPERCGRVIAYLEKHARPDGGYAWEDQEMSHLSPTFGVVGCYHALGLQPPRKQRLAEYILSHHPSQLKKLEQEHREFEFQQIQALVWIGADASSLKPRIQGWTKPTVYLKQYEQSGNPIFGHEITAFTCRSLLGLPIEGMDAYREFVDARRRPNGSFNGTPAQDGSDGHVMNTLWGLEALRTMGRLGESREQTIQWVRSCQLPGGGFTWSPKPEFAGVADVAYTWAALRSLRLLGAKLDQPESCVQWLLSLANTGGGFADQPGWNSNPMATYYALESLSILGQLDRAASAPHKAARRRPAIPPDLKVFTVQVEAHGQGSPIDAVTLAKSLRIHLWGAKNADANWIETAQVIADRQKAPVKFFVSNEEYGTWVRVPGLGTYSHTSDIIGPAKTDIGPSLAKQGVMSWGEFRDRRLAPLEKGGGRLIWQFGENEELVRLFLDDSVCRGGFAAISTFHFGNPDFTNSEPFLQRYRGVIPFIGLQDSHGPEPWWFADKTAGFRTVFLAKEPTYDAWIKALENNWTAAVRHDSVSNQNTWIHAGSDEMLELVRRTEKEWRWWNNPGIERPMASVAALTPADTLEAGHPESGVTIRVRCAWECAPQGQLKNPMAELAALSIDGIQVEPELKTRKSPKGLADHFYAYHLPAATPGNHLARARVKVLETGAVREYPLEFVMA